MKSDTYKIKYCNTMIAVVRCFRYSIVFKYITTLLVFHYLFSILVYVQFQGGGGVQVLILHRSGGESAECAVHCVHMC
jgi:hypothetical protein